ncbi:VirD4-like conjugal transfer protein, CD1115 family [Hazenella coriacea]|uniref:Type IV secretion system protein VirD4 n=1 Tax=Hazenella coriacea TaxID=1179467 RepID=A0A4V2UV90_9BACL|nr:type IV secretory system conjugative DNA transfer family protein [Hazenella coriacea]TCS94867.1 type IV secretion system protein VirD4 [Hazenella coriacea]
MIQLNMRPVVGSILLTLILLVPSELLIAGVIVTFPNLNTIAQVLLSDPIGVLQQAANESIFSTIQFGVLAGAAWLAYKFYKLLSGGGKYKNAAFHGAHGTSQEATPSQIFDGRQFVKHTWNKSPQRNLENSSGLIFGLLDDRPVILPEETKIPNRNIFIVGPPGSAKTQGYVLTNVIHERERSIVLTDPKGELFEATYQLKKQQGYQVHLVNFKEMSVSDRYNPIDYIGKEIDAEQVATTIVMNSQQDQKPDFWTTAAVALLKTLLLYVKYECPENATMAKVQEILTVYGQTPEEMDEFFNRLEPDHPAYRSYQIVRLAEGKTRASIFIILGTMLSKYNSSEVREFTKKSDFNFDDIGKQKTILYVILPVADQTWEPLISTFFNQLFQRLYDVADRNFNRLPVSVNLLLDEFPNLGKIPGYEEILATCRSYGISCSTIVQSFGQLIDKYNKEKAEAILANCSLRYLLGVNDKLTAEYFSELIGKTTVQSSSKSVSKSKGGASDSSSENYVQRNLYTPDELMRLDREMAILLITGMNPARLKKIFQFEFFKGLLNDENKTSRFDFLKLERSASDASEIPQEEDQQSEELNDIESDLDALEEFMDGIEFLHDANEELGDSEQQREKPDQKKKA